MNRDQAFDFLCKLAKMISSIFGTYCETVVQEPHGSQIKTLAIYNGHVSGRKVPTTMGILGGTLDESNVGEDGLVSDEVNQLVIHPTGKRIKSSSVVMRGEDYTLIFGVNYDLAIMDQLQSALHEFTTFEGDLFETLSGTKQRNHENIFEACADIVPVPVNRKTPKPQRHALIRLLNDQGFFSLQKSIPFLAGKVGVTKYTLYKDLAELGIRE